MIDEIAIVRQHLNEAALRLLHKRARRYHLKQVKLILRKILTERGYYSVRVRDTYEALIAAYLDEHERFERVSDEPEWKARRPP